MSISKIIEINDYIKIKFTGVQSTKKGNIYTTD